jgi:Tetracyclin repressor-like, C-terminal domain
VLTAIHRRKLTLVKEKRMHDIIVAATQENWAIIKAHIERMVTIFEAIIREGNEAGEFKAEVPSQAAHAINAALTLFLHPILIEHCVRHGEDTEAGLRKQIRFILKALGKSD